MSLFKKLIELEKEAAEFGFSWETATQIIEQIRSECAEIEDNLSVVAHPKLQEEIGDLLHAAFSLCVFCCFDPQDTLTKSITKFEKRFNHVKAIAQEESLSTLKGLSFSQLMALWNKAKQRESEQ